jgi:hypothetical protein
MNPTAITLSVWIKATTIGGGSSTYHAPIARRNVGSTSKAFIYVKNTTLNLAMGVIGSADVSYDGTGSHVLTTGGGAVWYYLVMTYDSTAGLVGYVNAASDHTVAANGTLNTTSSQTCLGQDINLSGSFFDGLIDEARVANVARSADWITTEYNNQNSPSTFYTVGTEVALVTVNAAAFFRIF